MKRGGNRGTKSMRKVKENIQEYSVTENVVLFENNWSKKKKE